MSVDTLNVCSVQNVTINPVSNLGTLLKVRIALGNTDTGDNWMLYQLNITNLGTNQNYYFFPNDYIFPGNVLELPGMLCCH